MRKLYIFGIVGITISVVLIALFFIFFFQKTMPDDILNKIREAEISLDKNGIVNIGSSKPKYESLELKYYYKYEECSEIIEKTVENFADSINTIKKIKIRRIDNKILEKLNISEDDIKFPIVVLDGNAEMYDSYDNFINSVDSFRTILNDVGTCSEKILGVLGHQRLQ